MPASWQSAIIIPLFKKGSPNTPNNPCNYRPISIACVTGQLMKSILKEYIVAHLYNHKLISKQQHEFLARRSTTAQLLERCRDWSVCMKSNKPVDVLYLDFAKAFDSVIYIKLVYKLKLYGISNMILKWVENCLIGRSQCVRVANSCSKLCPILSGVTQRCILGPVLFLIYINDICNSSHQSNVKLKLFAEYVKLYSDVYSTSDDNLQICLNNIVKWADLWQLKLSPSQFSVLSIGKSMVNTVYKINDTKLIEAVSNTDL